MSKAQPLTPADLRAWLESLPTEEVCGMARSGSDCPLAAYLDAVCGMSAAQVSTVSYWPDPDGPAQRLPAWARRFVRAVDDLDLANGLSPVTAATARRVLDEVAS